MGPYVTLVVLLALLAGLTVGKAWERYKLKDGRWIDRRRARESPHYMLGLNFLVANQIDPAIEELSTAAEAAGDPLEIHLILGNLYREKGQVGRAIQNVVVGARPTTANAYISIISARTETTAARPGACATGLLRNPCCQRQEVVGPPAGVAECRQFLQPARVHGLT